MPKKVKIKRVKINPKRSRGVMAPNCPAKSERILRPTELPSWRVLRWKIKLAQFSFTFQMRIGLATIKAIPRAK